MRVLKEKYDAIFNLFTSFGYFENEEDNLTTLIAKESFLVCFTVIDFLNVSQVLKTLVPKKLKRWKIDFHLKRYLKDGHIYKEIDFEDKGQKFHFTEKKL
jgi:hypothetical protein